jgi:hypothetical protein
VRRLHGFDRPISPNTITRRFELLAIPYQSVVVQLVAARWGIQAGASRRTAEMRRRGRGQIKRRSPLGATRQWRLGNLYRTPADGGAPEALTHEKLGTIERGTAEQPAPRGLRASRVPRLRERYYPFPNLGAELPGTGTGAFILPS